MRCSNLMKICYEKYGEFFFSSIFRFFIQTLFIFTSNRRDFSMLPLSISHLFQLKVFVFVPISQPILIISHDHDNCACRILFRFLSCSCCVTNFFLFMFAFSHLLCTSLFGLCDVYVCLSVRKSATIHDRT